MIPRVLSASRSLSVLALSCGIACGGGSSSPGNDTKTSESRSALARVVNPAVSEGDATTLAADNQQFAAELYQAVRQEAGNLVFSPESISVALAMTYAGAAGSTASQMATTLHFSLAPERLHPAFNALDQALNSRGAGQPSGAFQLHLANALWAQQGFGVLPSFLDTLAVNYGAGVRLVDFAAPEPARLTINQWVSDQTSGKIPSLLEEGSLDTNVKVVLTNAVYFKADWLTPFSGNSANSPFHAPTGDVSVPIMTGPENVTLWQGDGYKAASLPYVGEDVSFVVLVPDAGTFSAFEAGLSGDRLRAVLETDAAAQASVGALRMPRFAFGQRLPLARTLQSMGMPDAFTPGVANFTALDGATDLFIKDVVHQATIAVDEKGTEAAAATAVTIGRKSAALNALFVDRPFIFIIRDNPTHSIVFMGRVLDPSAS